MRALHFKLPKDGEAGRLRASWVGVALAVSLLPQFILAKKQSKEESRIEIIRKLGSEIAVAKVPLPRGKRGIFLNDKGQVNQSDADAELRQNGPAIRPGMPVEITKIIFKSEKIVFEINGGGKSGKKWYQHIEVGVGSTTHPISQQPPVLTYGSWITLSLREKIADVTSDQVKKLLDPVLDFERHSPTALYSPTVPPKIKDAIKNHQVVVGMDHDAVLSAKGPPDRKVREVREGVEQEDWIYGLPPHVLFVTFDGDTVISVRQF
ncbi:MAG TPA: hypothetical protein VKV95_03250 [Terriglobia bacterium]|nr:hypothetical protein [Terriglobia bacterium]